MHLQNVQYMSCWGIICRFYWLKSRLGRIAVSTRRVTLHTPEDLNYQQRWDSLRSFKGGAISTDREREQVV